MSVGSAAAPIRAMTWAMELQTITFADAAAFDRWLAEHHGRTEGIWIKVAKKGRGIRSITGDEMVDVGSCWGWISSLRHRLDDDHYLQKYTPRRPKDGGRR